MVTLVTRASFIVALRNGSYRTVITENTRKDLHSETQDSLVATNRTNAGLLKQKTQFIRWL